MILELALAAVRECTWEGALCAPAIQAVAMDEQRAAFAKARRDHGAWVVISQADAALMGLAVFGDKGFDH